jgi:hypothetical protein
MAKRRAGSQTGSLTSNYKKLGIDLIYLASDNMRHILESSQRGLQFCFRPHLDLKSIRKVTKLQSYGSPNWRNFGTPTWKLVGVLGEKSHLDVGPVERCRIYYKGEGGGFSQV